MKNMYIIYNIAILAVIGIFAGFIGYAIDVFPKHMIKSMQQTMPELSPEEYMKRDIESLRKYGFEPKF